MIYDIYHGISYELLDTSPPAGLYRYFSRPFDDSYDHRYEIEDFEEIEDDDEDCPF